MQLLDLDKLSDATLFALHKERAARAVIDHTGVRVAVDAAKNSRKRHDDGSGDWYGGMVGRFQDNLVHGAQCKITPPITGKIWFGQLTQSLPGTGRGRVVSAYDLSMDR